MADKFSFIEAYAVLERINPFTVMKKLADMGDGTHAEVVASTAYSPASDGVSLPTDSLAQTFSYNGDNTLNYIQVTFGGNNYRQTYTYSAGLVTNISTWVKQ